MAYESGFTGQRAVYTWKDRMKNLTEIGFIKSASGASGEFSYVLILNPYYVVKEIKKGRSPHISSELYNALYQRSLDIGAKDLTGADV
jgi:hypothetical protein